ncbi:MAG: class I SAM-dependent DNA methyltransferase [Spirulina sp. SIO3F2]|nr:class I SAM-dependent DNA methyltransferase [Spirulina sp. SIO3F2]
MSATPESLHNFVQFCQAHLTGDEKGEAQVFLDRFFRAFGHEGAIEAGATYEKRIQKGSKKGKTGFADLVWKPRVLIEMKKRGAKLSKHYSQAFDYWQRAVPNRPRYVMLCNFDEFWIYDFDIQIDTPIDQVSLTQLPERLGAFGFMQPREQASVFGNNQVEITEKAARRLGQDLYPDLWKRLQREQHLSQPEAMAQAQRFVLQCVLAMFAEDRGLLPDSLFVRCVQDCLNGESSYDVISRGLFAEMNQPGITPAGRFQGVDFFNGGLFAVVDSLELTPEELRIVEAAALEDWSKVRPAIFGNIFESAIDQQERHARGIHYTAEADIMKIVRPTISRFWEERIEGANTLKQLEVLAAELRTYRVLDPACGSGNFLYIAYQELKQIEQTLLDKIAARRRSQQDQLQIGFVTPLQFFGIDNNPFAVELARVTLMIARKVAIDRLSLQERALPLDTLDKNIICADALFTDWPQADAIIGNPPFLGGSRIRLELGDNYAEKVFAKFSNIRAQVDFASYWFRLAHEHIQQTGRAGLVATNSISQGKSRSVALEYITQNNGYIHEAISTQPWSGEAVVHVSLVNWSAQQPNSYYLDNKKVSTINSSLTSNVDLTASARLSANRNKSFIGVQPNGKGFLIEKEDVDKWIVEESKNREVLKPFSMGGNLAKNPHGKPDRWIIDFADMSLEEVNNYKLPFEYVKSKVKPERMKNRESILREKWWRFKRTNESLRTAVKDLDTYFATPRVSKWIMFIPFQAEWLPGDLNVVVSSSDYYLLGILISHIHRLWAKVKSSTLKGDTRYTPSTCFETFPFPQTPTKKLTQQIRAKAIELHEYRSEQMEQKQWGITKLYNAYFDEPASQLYQLHKELDKLVLRAYGFKAKDDILAKLLELNLELAEKEKNGEAVVGPWAIDNPPEGRDKI